MANTLVRGRVLEGRGEQIEDVVVSPELGEVFEREIDRTVRCASTAQVAELGELSLSAGHVVRIHRRADFPLHWD